MATRIDPFLQELANRAAKAYLDQPLPSEPARVEVAPQPGST